jgi:low affinity Fe/Cu permease
MPCAGAAFIRSRPPFRPAGGHKVVLHAGSWQLFVLSIALLLTWGLSGPLFRFSDTWQLVVNTSTTILTYLLGILILLEANRQSKEWRVVQDELISARNELINIDQMSEDEIDEIEARLRRRACAGPTPHRPGRKGAGRWRCRTGDPLGRPDRPPPCQPFAG